MKEDDFMSLDNLGVTIRETIQDNPEETTSILEEIAFSIKFPLMERKFSEEDKKIIVEILNSMIADFGKEPKEIQSEIYGEDAEEIISKYDYYDTKFSRIYIPAFISKVSRIVVYNEDNGITETEILVEYANDTKQHKYSEFESIMYKIYEEKES